MENESNVVIETDINAVYNDSICAMVDALHEKLILDKKWGNFARTSEPKIIIENIFLLYLGKRL